MQRMIGFPIRHTEEELSSGCTFDLTVGSHRSLFSCWARGNDALVNCELQSLRDLGFNLARSFRRTSRQRSTASALSRQKDSPPENVASVCVLI